MLLGLSRSLLIFSYIFVPAPHQFLKANCAKNFWNVLSDLSDFLYSSAGLTMNNLKINSSNGNASISLGNDNNSCYIAPIRTVEGIAGIPEGFFQAAYNPTTKEIIYCGIESNITFTFALPSSGTVKINDPLNLKLLTLE